MVEMTEKSTYTISIYENEKHDFFHLRDILPLKKKVRFSGCLPGYLVALLYGKLVVWCDVSE